jgi:cytidylate kinase
LDLEFINEDFLNREPIIAIDGPSGAGKSTLSRLLARSLGYVQLDTGAMYRAVALAARKNGTDPEDDEALGRLCERIAIRFVREGEVEKVYLGDQDVTEAIRTPELSLLTSRISASPAVRRAMVRLQRAMGAGGGVVLEGRDIGTVVFPEAEVKFFLRATARERGRRRFEELRAKGLEVDLERTIAEVEARDRADSSRRHAPLEQAADAVPIDSTALSIDQVLKKMLEVVRERRRRAGLPETRCEGLS